jgi:hypothetical protein
MDHTKTTTPKPPTRHNQNRTKTTQNRPGPHLSSTKILFISVLIFWNLLLSKIMLNNDALSPALITMKINQHLCDPAPSHLARGIARTQTRTRTTHKIKSSLHESTSPLPCGHHSREKSVCKRHVRPEVVNALPFLRLQDKGDRGGEGEGMCGGSWNTACVETVLSATKNQCPPPHPHPTNAHMRPPMKNFFCACACV